MRMVQGEDLVMMNALIFSCSSVVVILVKFVVVDFVEPSRVGRFGRPQRLLGCGRQNRGPMVWL